MSFLPTGAGSGSNQGPVGCLGAMIAFIIMMAVMIAFVAALYWAIQDFE